MATDISSQHSCEDRIDRSWSLRQARSTDGLQGYQSMTAKAIPKVSSITRSPKVLLDSDLNLGLLDMTVDDGSHAELNDTVRSLRFSTAASNIDALLGQRAPLSPLSIGSDNRPPKQASEEKNDKKRPGTDEITKGKDSFAANPKLGPLNLESVDKFKQRLDFFDTEPITPPRSTEQYSAEDHQTATVHTKSFLPFTRTMSPRGPKRGSKESRDHRAQSPEQAGQTPWSGPVSPGKRALLSTLEASRKLGKSFRGKNDEANIQDNLSDSQEDNNAQGEQGNRNSQSRRKSKVLAFLSKFVD